MADPAADVEDRDTAAAAPASLATVRGVLRRSGLSGRAVRSRRAEQGERGGPPGPSSPPGATGPVGCPRRSGRTVGRDAPFECLGGGGERRGHVHHVYVVAYTTAVRCRVVDAEHPWPRRVPQQRRQQCRRTPVAERVVAGSGDVEQPQRHRVQPVGVRRRGHHRLGVDLAAAVRVHRMQRSVLGQRARRWVAVHRRTGGKDDPAGAGVGHRRHERTGALDVGPVVPGRVSDRLGGVLTRGEMRYRVGLEARERPPYRFGVGDAHPQQWHSDRNPGTVRTRQVVQGGHGVTRVAQRTQHV